MDIETAADNHIKPSPGKSYLTKAIKFILAAVVIYFAGRQLVVNWAEVSQCYVCYLLQDVVSSYRVIRF
jgi:hypothetical protein